jgi:hypothetical protein
MHGMCSDIRLGLRLLRKSAGFSAAVVLTLAVAIAANTAIFTVANVMLFRPLPYPDADRIVMLRSVSPSRGLFDERVAGANFLDWQTGGELIEAMAAFRWRTVDLTGAGQSERLRGLMIASRSCGFLPAPVGIVFASDRGQKETGTRSGSCQFPPFMSCRRRWPRTRVTAPRGRSPKTINNSGKNFFIHPHLPVPSPPRRASRMAQAFRCVTMDQIR